MPKVSEAYLASRRQHILDAAIACFARNGFHQTTTDDICREAGISPGALYGYFSSKEDIIKVVAALENQDDRMDSLVKEMGTTNDFLQVETLLTYWFSRLERPKMDTAMRVRVRSWAEALQNPQVEEDVLARWQDRFATGEEWIRRGQERGDINPNLDTRSTARALQAVLDGFVLQWTIDPDIEIWKFLEVVMALFGGSFWQGEQKPETNGQLSATGG